LNEGQTQHGNRVVVGRHSIVTLEAAGQTAMDEHLLSVRTAEQADGGHLAPARAGAVARDAPVDVPGMEAQRAVVAVVPPPGERADEGLALDTAEMGRRVVALLCLPGPRGQLLALIAPKTP
jgi:hypothetical protein